MICNSLGSLLRHLYLHRLSARSGHIWYAVHQLKRDDNEFQRHVYDKVSSQYGIVSAQNRYYRRKQGRAIVEAALWKNAMILMATDGEHDVFFESQKRTGLHRFDVRPLILQGYAVDVNRGKPRVLIEGKRWESIRQNYLERLWKYQNCSEYVANITPFSFKTIHQEQVKPLIKAINRKRKKGGLPLI